MDEGLMGLLAMQRELEDSLAVTLKINHAQVTELVTADLLSKYKHCVEYPNDNNRKDKEAFETILKDYYLDADEFREATKDFKKQF